MNFIESTNFFVRTIMFDFVNADPNIKLKFRVAPMIHIGSEEYYQMVVKKIKDCDEIFYEGVYLIDKKEKPYKKLSLKNFQLIFGNHKTVAEKLGLVYQSESMDLSELKDKLTHTDFNPETGAKAWQQVSLKEKVKHSLIEPVQQYIYFYRGITRERLAKLFMTSNREAYLAYGPLEDEEGTSHNFIMNQREQIIFQNIKNRMETESHLDKTIGIIYGAGHMNSIARYLIDQLNYVPRNGQFLKVFDVV